MGGDPHPAPTRQGPWHPQTYTGGRGPKRF